MKKMITLTYNRRTKMNKPRLKKLAAMGMLALSATALSLPAFSHQQSTGMMGDGGHMGMMQGKGGMMGGGMKHGQGGMMQGQHSSSQTN